MAQRMAQPAPTFPLHTVAVYLPGTANRVLVTQLDGTRAEAIETARQVLQQFAFVAPVRWASKVVSTNVVTDVTTPHSSQEIAE